MNGWMLYERPCNLHSYNQRFTLQTCVDVAFSVSFARIERVT